MDCIRPTRLEINPDAFRKNLEAIKKYKNDMLPSKSQAVFYFTCLLRWEHIKTHLRQPLYHRGKAAFYNVFLVSSDSAKA